jgi:hypothetical protein
MPDEAIPRYRDMEILTAERRVPVIVAGQ